MSRLLAEYRPKVKRDAFFAVLLFAIALPLVAKDIYRGMCDASAAVAIDASHFIVANDEDNVLRIFHIDKEHPVRKYDMSGFLGISYDDKSPESDIEGAARIGEFIVFITSHGRDKKGRLRTNRHQLFAVKVDKQLNIIPVGKPYNSLMNDLTRVKSLKKISLYNAYLPNDKKEEKLAPKIAGVNIEGLASIPGTEQCIIGFRNPIPDEKALLIVLENPLQVLLDKEEPRFGKTMFLSLGNRGIRSIIFHPGLQKYVLVGGSSGSTNRSQLFLWSGEEKDQPDLIIGGFSNADNYNPEAVILYPDSKMLQLLSDDGAILVNDGAGDACACKDLEEVERKTFRSRWIKESELR